MSATGSADEAVRRAIELLRVGQKDEGREILKDVLRRDRENPRAWAAMAQAVESSQEAILCLKQVLRLKPGDPWATKQLQRARENSRAEAAVGQPAPGPEPAPVGHQAPGAADASARIKALRRSLSRAQPRESGQALRAGPAHDPIARARSQQLASPAQAGTMRELLPFTGAQAKTGAFRSSSVLMVFLGLLLGAVVVAVGFTVWDEFFATYPEDERKVTESACEWTRAVYQMDYDRLSDLVCRDYAAEMDEARRMNMVTGTFARSLGVDMSRELPSTLRCEVESMRGSKARVHVYGLMGDLGSEDLESFGIAFMDELIYIMRREGR